jgi:hypothetical protein
MSNLPLMMLLYLAREGFSDTETTPWHRAREPRHSLANDRREGQLAATIVINFSAD